MTSNLQEDKNMITLTKKVIDQAESINYLEDKLSKLSSYEAKIAQLEEKVAAKSIAPPVKAVVENSIDEGKISLSNSKKAKILSLPIPKVNSLVDYVSDNQVDKETYRKLVHATVQTPYANMHDLQKGATLNGITLSASDNEFYSASGLLEGYIVPELLDATDCGISFNKISQLYGYTAVNTNNLIAPRIIPQDDVSFDAVPVDDCNKCSTPRPVDSFFAYDYNSITVPAISYCDTLLNSSYDYNNYQPGFSPLEITIKKMQLQYEKDYESAFINGFTSDANSGWLSATQNGVGFTRYSTPVDILHLAGSIATAVSNMPEISGDIVVVAHQKLASSLGGFLNRDMQVVSPIKMLDEMLTNIIGFNGTGMTSRIKWLYTKHVPEPKFTDASRSKFVPGSFVVAVADWKKAYRIYDLHGLRIETLRTLTKCDRLLGTAAFTGAVECGTYGAVITASEKA